MNDREKLIGLMGKARTSLWGKNIPDIPTENRLIADYLITNNVVIQKEAKWIEVDW